MKKCIPWVILSICFFMVLISCSSSPRNRLDIYNLRDQAESALVSGNSEAAKGNFDLALLLLTEAKRYAILSDDFSLIARVSLSRGNVLFSLDFTDLAFEEWEQAISNAVRIGNSELLSVCRIYYARGNLLSGRESPQTVLDTVTRESASLRTDRLYIAFSWQVRGLALRAMGNYTDAEAAFQRSLDIHNRDGYLENASYDWYTIASIRSLSGNLTGALTALETSMALDRRIENSWGLAASWRAMGDVLTKAGRHSEAQEAYDRSSLIYAAMGIGFSNEE